MRKVTSVALVALALSVLPARNAEAQFWRFFERLSGPDLQGPGFDIAFACRGDEIGEAGPSVGWFPSPQCIGAARNRPWISTGVQVYALIGDNTETAEEHDRVDAFGFLPFVDLNLPVGFAVGGGVGVRRYWAAAGGFNKADVEFWLKWKPFVTFAGRGTARAAAPSFGLEFLEIRVAGVVHPEFRAGELGPGSRAIETEVSRPVVFIVFNLLQ